MLFYYIFTTSLSNMVRNTKGGKGAKSLARKSVSGGSGFPIPSSDMEHIAIVEKMWGPTCHVLLNDGSRLLCHIRNKFKGRHKTGNLIRVGTIILIGYREWESDKARKNCDLMFVYDDLQTSSLAENFTLPVIDSGTSTSEITFDNSTFIPDDDTTTTTNTITTTTTIPTDFDLL